jgi:hypothetical protein
MQGWEPRALDTDLANFTINWSIARSQERAKDGNTALKLYLENNNDKGKIWVEHNFDVQPNTQYNVNISYAFASADWGDANHFIIITGVLPKSPQSRDELVYQGSTANGADSDVGFLWLDKQYSFVAQSDSTGKLHAVIGVWGVWETARTYFIDSVKITFAAAGS